MSTPHVQEELLHRYFDGEVGAREAERVRAHVDACADCAARIASLSKLHRMLAVAADDLRDEVHSEALYARVAAGARAAPAPGLGERLRLWWDDLLEPLQPRGVRVPLMVAALGVAAAVVVALRPPPRPEARPSPGTAVAVKEPSGPAPAPAPLLARVVASEIVTVDSGLNPATIFPVEVGEGVSTPVVWIEE